MNVEYTGRQYEISPLIRKEVETGLNKIRKILGDRFAQVNIVACRGGLTDTFAQGVVLGAFVQGFPIRDGQFAGTSFAFLTPFSVLTGVALMFGYGLQMRECQKAHSE